MKLVVVIKSYVDISLKGLEYAPLSRMDVMADGSSLDTYISDMCEAADSYCRRNKESRCNIVDYKPRAFCNGRIIVLKTVINEKPVIQTTLMYTTAQSLALRGCFMHSLWVFVIDIWRLV